MYIATVTCYPSYLTVKVGILDFSVSRIIILAAYLSLLFYPQSIKKFRFNYLDALVIAYFMAQFIARVMTTDFLDFWIIA